MRLRRLALSMTAASLVVGWALGTTAGAVGTAAPTLTFTSPSGDGVTISSSPVVLSGTVTRPGGNVDSVEVLVEWIDKAAGRPKIAHPDQREVVAPAIPTSSYSWSFPLAPTANGQYRVIVTATTDDATPQKQQQQNIASSTFFLDVPPATPANFTETTQKAQRTAALAWTANQEPDLIGYVLFRGGPNSNDPVKYLNGVYAPATSYTDSTLSSQPAGTYRYVILAVRPGAQGGTYLDYSQASGEANAVLAGPPVSPSPTTVAPGSSSSGIAPVGSSAAARAGAIGAAPVLPGGDPLSAYQGLVNQAQATTATTQPPDPGFSNKLPYQPKTTQQPVTSPGDGAALGAPDSSGGGGGGTQQTVEYVAAALILAVVAMFGMLLKRAADQAPALEAAPLLPSDFEAEAEAEAPGERSMEALPTFEALPEPVLAGARAYAPEPVAPAHAHVAPRWSARRRPQPAEADWGLSTLLSPVAPDGHDSFDRELGFDDLDYEASLAGAPAERPLRSGWR